MANQNSRIFAEISKATISAVHRDMAENPRFTTMLMYELTRDNPDVALDLLADARDAADERMDTEAAYISGAAHVIALILKQIKAAELTALLNPTELEAA